MAYVCIQCRQERENDQQFSTIPCPGRSGHVLQEMIIGARNPETGERADFIPVGPEDVKQWVERAKKAGFITDDEY